MHEEAARREWRKEAQEQQKKDKRNNQIQQIKELKPRIQNLLTLAKECKSLGISFPSPTQLRSMGYGDGHYGFESDGIYHQIGFTKEYPNFIGIKAGGYFGNVDMFTDGDTVNIPEDGTFGDRFLKDFPEFEKAFLAWIDSLGE